ncbi:O-antigen ligase family protein [Antribacter gilvus]|uniref:O-antigen ligase family protein n=1 Tax=Antribacter gilvus TaxID=2304675 RepID=UPI000F77192F|nr:hypothetical protein [Antribacter gilvus]
MTLVLMLCTMLVPLLWTLHNKGDVAFYLLVPTIMSASQNVYLLTTADELEASELQFAIVLNFAFAVLAWAALLGARSQAAGHATDRGRALRRTLAACAFLVTAYGLVSSVIFAAPVTSALASYRNLITPMLFTAIGLLAAGFASPRRYMRMLVVLGVLSCAFGLLEMTTPRFWQDLGIKELWEDKGIGVNPSTGVPSNYFSSELIGGSQIRRMVGPFADPVNFGTFLFAVFMAAWAVRARVAAAVMVVASAFAVSKGALVGFLAYFAYWTRYFASRTHHVVAIMVALAGAAYFYGFSLRSSTGSTTAHINGLLAAFLELPQHPLGRGMGNIGVLSNLFGEGAESNVTESGLGMIVGQLGIVGLTVYVVFFAALLKAAFRVRSRRPRLMAVGLLVGFIINATFNEVALSPNSAAPYFVMIGLVLGRDLMLDQENESYAAVDERDLRLEWGPASGIPSPHEQRTA